MSNRRSLVAIVAAGILLLALSSCSAGKDGDSTPPDSTCVWNESTWNNCKLGN